MPTTSMTRVRFLVLALLLVAAPAWAVESLDLTTPETKPSVTSCEVARLVFDWRAARIEITLKCQTDDKQFVYDGTTATDMMKALNKANLSTNSLHKRVMNQLVTDGKLAGSVVGSPD